VLRHVLRALGKERGSTDGGGDEGVLRHVGGGCDEGGKW
jgi:hypothetical protein